MRHNKDNDKELIWSEYTNPIEFYAVIIVDIMNGINIFDAAFPDEEQAEKYRHEEERKLEKNVDESTTLIVRKAVIDIK